MSALSGQPDDPLSRVVLLSQEARNALAAGRASECLSILDQLATVTDDDQSTIVWALTASAGCRAVLGQLRRAQADLAQARQLCGNAAPVLAEPFWRFTGVVCNWLAGGWASAEADAAAQVSRPPGPLSAFVPPLITGLRTELLRGLGRAAESRRLADTLRRDPTGPLSAWALAGLEAESHEPVKAMRRLAAARADSLKPPVLPLVLERLAEVAFTVGDTATVTSAAAALAELDQAAPLTAIMHGLAAAYASGDRGPAVDAQEMAAAQGARTLVAEALTVRGRIGDNPAATLTAAYAVWRRIGAVGRLRTVAGAMRAAGLTVPAARQTQPSVLDYVGPLPLTARERHLARLVHEGRSNQQIASALDISVKTVEAYLTRLYRKTSCASRVDLAVAVTEGRIQVDE
jgi:DNA-binding NarL/FixJ family response regulator